MKIYILEDPHAFNGKTDIVVVANDNDSLQEVVEEAITEYLQRSHDELSSIKQQTFPSEPSLHYDVKTVKGNDYTFSFRPAKAFANWRP